MDRRFLNSAWYYPIGSLLSLTLATLYLFRSPWNPALDSTGFLLAVSALSSFAVRKLVDGYVIPAGLFRLDTSFLIASYFLCGRGYSVILVLSLIVLDTIPFGRSTSKSGRLLAETSRGMLALAALDCIWNQFGTSLPIVSPASYSFLAALCAMLAFSCVDQLTLAAQLWCDRKREWFSSGLLTAEALLGQTVALFVALATVLLWPQDPFLTVLVLLPVWALFILLQKIHSEEAALRRRQEELSHLQHLGLQIGSQLEPGRLNRMIVRMCTRALEASATYLGRWDGANRMFYFVETDLSPIGIPVPSARPDQGVGRQALAGPGFIENDYRAGDQRYPELAGLDPGRVLAYPLGTKSPWGILVVYASQARRPFGTADLRKLDTLSSFIAVAVRNALLVEQLREAQAALSQTEKMSALGELISRVAHEINNPLSGIVGCAQLALANSREGETRELLHMIESEAQRSTKIVRQLLAFSRKKDPELRTIQVNDVIRHVLALQQMDSQKKQVEVLVFLDPALPQTRADCLQIEQVLINLITNAVDSMETTPHKRLTLRSGVEDQMLYIDVEDSGPGISPDTRQHVFDLFFSTKAPGKGTGLGLSISLDIMQHHNGALRVLGTSAAGTTFRIELPVLRSLPVGNAVQ
ncbi:MAG: sensor histidine kinase [Acidobacteriota bacterium]